MLFQGAKKLLGIRLAVAAFGPTSWTKLHDEMKVYCGYIRFIEPLALAASRAMVYRDISLTGPNAPAFNPSAACALLVLLVLEALEDAVVIHELLPMSPIPTELLGTSVVPLKGFTGGSMGVI